MKTELISEFKSTLQQNGLKITPERIMVFEEVNKTSSHFEADDLYMRLRRRKHRVSRATVYRTLELLVDNGFVAKVNIGADSAYYENAHARVRHEHLVCTECGKIIEFRDSVIEERQEEVCAKHDFLPTKHNLMIFGICSECQKRKG